MTAAAEHVSELRVEFCRNEDVPALRDFIATHRRSNHILSRDEALLRWQFAPQRLGRAPDAGPTVLLARLDGAIVGMIGLTGFDLNLGRNSVPAAWLSQWLVAPRYRDQMAGLRLVWAAKQQGLPLATAGANSIAARLLERIGLTPLPALERWLGVFQVAAAARLAPTADLAVFRRHEIANGTTTTPRGLRLVAWTERTAAAWDRCWTDHIRQRYIGACRDAAFLRWRYLEHPCFSYQVRFVQREADGSVLGLVVWRVEQIAEYSTCVLRVVDLLGVSDAEEVLARVVRHAGNEVQAAWADFYCSAETFAAPLRRIGFRLADQTSGPNPFPTRLQPVERGSHPIVPLWRLPDEAPRSHTVYCTKSDGDQDRPN